MEQTVVIIKPDAMQQKHMGEIISMLEREGLTIKKGKLTLLTKELLSQWYAHHANKPFFPDIVAFMTECPVMAMVWEGDQAVSRVRTLCGPTDSTKAGKDTIRGRFGTDIQRNAVHASENQEAAEKEVRLLFT